MKRLLISFLIIISVFFSSTFSFAVLTALNLDMAEFNLPSKWIYEGVTFSDDMSTKRYTLISNLDVYILYGNKDMYELIQKKLPFVSKDSLESSFSDQDFAELISSASGSSCQKMLYGDNIFYEFEKSQKVPNSNKIVNSVVDMCFIDGYIHTFSYSYQDTKDNYQEYINMLGSFKIKGSNEETPKNEDISSTTPIAEAPLDTQPILGSEYIISGELANEIVQNINDVNISNNESLKEDAISDNKTEIATIEPTEEKNIDNNDAKIEEENIDNNVTPFISGEENENNLEIENTSNDKTTEIDDEEFNIYSGEENESTNKNIVPVKLAESKPLIATVFGLPIVRILLIVFLTIDIVIFLIIKHKKKNK